MPCSSRNSSTHLPSISIPGRAGSYEGSIPGFLDPRLSTTGYVPGYTRLFDTCTFDWAWKSAILGKALRSRSLHWRYPSPSWRVYSPAPHRQRETALEQDSTSVVRMYRNKMRNPRDCPRGGTSAWRTTKSPKDRASSMRWLVRSPSWYHHGRHPSSGNPEEHKVAGTQSISSQCLLGMDGCWVCQCHHSKPHWSGTPYLIRS